MPKVSKFEQAIRDTMAQYDKSDSWKDRHGRGIRVEMTTEEWRECLLKSAEGDVTEFCMLDASGVKYYKGAPSVSFIDKGVKATFCNFHYKTSWLVKKGYTVAVTSDGSIPPRIVKGGPNA